MRGRIAPAQPAPRQLDIMVTVGCNARCAFCVQEATFKPAPTDDVSFRETVRVHMGWFYGVGGRRVVITGGEPLLRVPRVLDVLGELHRHPDLEVKALYTNGEHLLDQRGDGGTVAEQLSAAGLGAVNLSVHHYDDATNNRILGLPKKKPTAEIAAHLRGCGMPFRVNLALQRGGIDSLEAFLAYLDWAFGLGATDVYARDLFRFTFDRPLGQSDRDAVAYCDRSRVDTPHLVELLRDTDRLRCLGESRERERDKVEHAFEHTETKNRVYVSRLVVGTEKPEAWPYAVVMPDGRLYRGWLGERDLADIEWHDAGNSARTLDALWSARFLV